MSLPESTPKLALNHGLSFAELFTPEGLQKIDGLFLDRLRNHDARACDTLIAWREGREPLTPLQVSELLLTCGPVLDNFIAGLFGIKETLEASQQRTLAHDPVFHFTRPSSRNSNIVASRLDSYICPGRSGVPGATSSSPVATTSTRAET